MTVSKANKYEEQNKKIKAINFRKPRFVKKVNVILPMLKKRVGLTSMGVTVMLAIEYCQQERVFKDFLNFVNQRRRSLLD